MVDAVLAESGVDAGLTRRHRLRARAGWLHRRANGGQRGAGAGFRRRRRRDPGFRSRGRGAAGGRARARRRAGCWWSTTRACARSTGRNSGSTAWWLCRARSTSAPRPRCRCRTVSTVAWVAAGRGLAAWPALAERCRAQGASLHTRPAAARPRDPEAGPAEVAAAGQVLASGGRVAGLCQGPAWQKRQRHETAIDCRCNAHATKPSPVMPRQQTCQRNRFWSLRMSARFAR